jgi:predicted methyltransferase
MRFAQVGLHACRAAIIILLAGLTVAGPATRAADSVDPKLAAAVNSNFRSAADRARDPYRHPLQTLIFFGIRPNMTVVELWPFGGWYTAILAPYLHDRGTLYAAAMDPASSAAEDKRYNSELAAMLAAHPEVYGKVQVTVLAPHRMQIAPDGTADMVVTFRNIHNWVWDGIEKDVLAAAFRALKPGGILGVEEHRNNDAEFIPKNPAVGYVGEQYAIEQIQSAGFRLVGQSNVNRNPKDTKDYPSNVWSLPPTYAEGDKDRAKYAAIGESDRFTLKFIKPKG